MCLLLFMGIRSFLFDCYLSLSFVFNNVLKKKKQQIFLHLVSSLYLGLISVLLMYFFNCNLIFFLLLLLIVKVMLFVLHTHVHVGLHVCVGTLLIFRFVFRVPVFYYILYFYRKSSIICTFLYNNKLVIWFFVHKCFTICIVFKLQ